MLKYDKNFKTILFQVLNLGYSYSHTLPLQFRKFLLAYYDFKTPLTAAQKQQFIYMLKAKDVMQIGYARFLESMQEDRRLTNSEIFALKAFHELSKDTLLETSHKLSTYIRNGAHYASIPVMSLLRHENEEYLAERDKVSALMLKGLKCLHKNETEEENALSYFKKAFYCNSTEAYFKLAELCNAANAYFSTKKFLFRAADRTIRIILENRSCCGLL